MLWLEQGHILILWWPTTEFTITKIGVNSEQVGSILGAMLLQSDGKVLSRVEGTFVDAHGQRRRRGERERESGRARGEGRERCRLFPLYALRFAVEFTEKRVVEGQERALSRAARVDLLRITASTLV